MLTVSPIFIIVIIAVMVSSQPLHNDPEMTDNMDHTSRVKRQWDGWSYKFKTPFYKMKIKTPFSFGGGIHPFGGGYGPFGYHSGGYWPMGFSGFHMPNIFGWHNWL